MSHTSKVNRIVEQAVLVLSSIDSDLDPGTWKTKPNLVEHGLVLSSMISSPAILLQMVHQDDTPLGGPGKHRTTGRLGIRCVSDGVKEMNDLIDDVQKALSRDDDDAKLGGEVMRSYTGATIDAENPKDGMSIAYIEVGMIWDWSHD
jgi:hypothetical protein